MAAGGIAVGKNDEAVGFRPPQQTAHPADHVVSGDRCLLHRHERFSDRGERQFMRWQCTKPDAAMRVEDYAIVCDSRGLQMDRDVARHPSLEQFGNSRDRLGRQRIFATRRLTELSQGKPARLIDGQWPVTPDDSAFAFPVDAVVDAEADRP